MPPDAMSEAVSSTRRTPPLRLRALIFPREHGAWGLLLVPLFSGAAVGWAATHGGGPSLILFIATVLALFWLRTPVESLLGTTALKAETPAERGMAFFASFVLTLVSAGCLTVLLWRGRHGGLLPLGGIGAMAFLVQTVLMKSGRQLRMSAQMVGAIGLTCTAPAAYYVITNHLDSRAWILWAANWLFAGNQIHFVQLRIHAARAASFGERWARGRMFFVAQILFLPILAMASRWRLISPWLLLAFVPALMRGFYWLFRSPQPLRVKSLGWSEMRQGILFGILLAATIILS
jgi:hypothetical protein